MEQSWFMEIIEEAVKEYSGVEVDKGKDRVDNTGAVPGDESTPLKQALEETLTAKWEAILVNIVHINLKEYLLMEILSN